MPAKTEKTLQSSDAPPAEATPRPSFITPEMIEKNPLLEVAGKFSGDPYWKELMTEIKKERAKQRRREAKQAK